jgi:hypothetical protein
VLALAVSGSTVYAGGSFTSVGGQARRNLAALNIRTGAATAFNPNPTLGRDVTGPTNGTVRAFGGVGLDGIRGRKFHLGRWPGSR